MKARDMQQAFRDLPLGTLADLTDGKPFLVLSPHPDDESLGCGGLIAAACEAGQRAAVVILTDGAGSHTASKTYPPWRLAALRKTEAAEAARHLGLQPGDLTHLNLPDAQTPQEGPVFDAAVGALVDRIERLDAASLFVTWGHDPHCDHEAADRMARAVRHRRPHVKLWSYPIWGWHRPPDDEVDAPAPTGHRIDITAWLAKKHAAIAAHASQMSDLIADDPAGFRFDATTIGPFLGAFEYFIEVPA